MRYLLKWKDITVLIFSMSRTLDGISVTDVIVEQPSKLPLDLSVDHLDTWLRRRTIPANRAYVGNFLAKLGLQEKDIIGITDVSKSLSLNDCYWVVPADFNGLFAGYNLYENRFSGILSAIAFTGYGSAVRSTFQTSPEFTTNGMLAKCWRRVDGQITLYKSGTEGAANTGKEPYSEFLSYQIAKAMEISAVPYQLRRWKGKLCSTCPLFTSQDVGFLPAGALIPRGGITAVLEYYKNLGDSYYNDLITMFLLDAVLHNTDRHLGNFGFLVDQNTNQITGTAPIFDNGLSLFCYSLDDSFEEMLQYSQTRTPALYDNFTDILKDRLTPQHKEQLRALIDFRFKAHPRYNMDKKRIKLIEKVIHHRVQELLRLE